MTVRGEGSSLRLTVAAKPTWRNIPYVLPKVILHFISFGTDIGVGPRQALARAFISSCANTRMLDASTRAKLTEAAAPLARNSRAQVPSERKQ